MRGKGQERIAQYQRLDFSDIAHIMGFDGTTPRADSLARPRPPSQVKKITID